MRSRVCFFTTLLLGCAAPSFAADTLRFGPAAGWVQPLTVPNPLVVNQDAPFVIVMLDSQVRFEPGRITAYAERVIRFQQPAGLQAGTLAIQWSPELDDVTVNNVSIERGGKVIDVLKSGQTFQVLRREQNLDQAVLDGTLTAVLQPEGLQVGDTLRIATSTTRRDPVLGEHAELMAGVPSGVLPEHARLLVEWSETAKLRFQAFNMDAAKVTTNGGMKYAEWRLDNPKVLVLPDDAPGRYQWGRQAEFTDFGSWAEIGTLLAPLYDRASVIPDTGPLRTELQRMRAASADPKTRAQAALRLVQDQVRYVALQMGAGGLTPTIASTTWSRRFGDCKAKTALLLGLLRELGIVAVPVAVNAQNGDGIDKRLPLIALFDHVLVRASIGGRDYWLDGTRPSDPALDLIEVPAFGWGLPLEKKKAELVRLMPGPARRPSEETTILIDARKGRSVRAPVKVEVVFRGESANAANLLLSSAPQGTRDQLMKAFWKDRLSHVEPTATSFRFDRELGQLHMVMEGATKLNLTRGRYWVDVPVPGYKPDFDRPAGPYERAPFALNYPSYITHKETILLSEEMSGALSHSDPIDRTVAGVRYRRTTIKDGATFVIESSSQVLEPELAFATARASESELRSLKKEDFYVVVDKPTPEEIDEALKQNTDNVAELIWRAASLAWSGRFKESTVEYEKVLAKEPHNAKALEGRGYNRAQLGELKLAREDYEAAAKVRSGPKR